MISKGTAVLMTILALAGLALAAGCRSTASPTAAPSQTAGGQAATQPPAATATLEPTPTATPEPLAARVAGEGISLAEYEAELRQLQDAHAALAKTVTPEQQRQQVLDSMIDTLLLAQGAAEAGFVIDDAALQVEIDRLAGQMGGAQALADWYTRMGYSEPVFRAALRRQMAAAYQRDQIAASVPETAEQVHARQILTREEDTAKRAMEQVKVPGVNFAAQAYAYDPATGGDLGWFPRGYLLQPEVEEAAFALQPGEISPIVQSSIGYHILQVISREPARVLSPDARRVLQHNALEDWLKARREAAVIEILLP